MIGTDPHHGGRASTYTSASQRNERGIFGFESLPLLVLVFVIGTLVFAEGWTAIDAKLATTSGAREATRTFVESPAGMDPGVAAAIAVEAGLSAMEAYSRRLEAEVSGIGSLSLDRCTRVTFEATATTRFMRLPFVRNTGFTRIVRSSHTELVDPWRDGLQGTACD